MAPGFLGVQPRAEQLDLRVSNQIGIAGIGQAGRQPIGQAQAVIDLPQGQHASVTREPFGPVFDGDRSVEIEPEKRMLRFTQGVHLRVRSVSLKTPTKLHGEAAFSSPTPRA
jgi:hypothetical protein